ncbi:isoleucine N-monooxygenase 2-like [Coffea eugenioides]|uniref:isoleucine N-monooxygenase 2-like n=1 Tax=Coffea eugenioides TaxID=49369 RepID=UPI000F6082DD|nr:isoleucine N-monooxygenase 2-like [Coffea eugenioides]
MNYTSGLRVDSSLGFTSVSWIPFFSGFMALVLLVIFMMDKWLTICLKNNKPRRFPLPPGPKSLPFFGCIFQMLKNRPTNRWICKVMDDLNTEIACIRTFGVHIIPVTSPELAREFCKKQDSIFSSRPVFMSAELCSEGFLTTALSPMGDQYKKMKRMVVSSVLSPAKHQWLQCKRAEEADHLVNYVYNQCKYNATGGLVDIRLVTQHYCGNVIRKMIFNIRFFGKGMEDGGPGAEEVEHINALFKILAYLYAFSLSDYMPWMKIFDFDGHRKILTEAVACVRKHQDPEIEKRIKMWESGVKNEEEDLLDVLIRLKDSNGRPLLTTEEIRAQITELMFATVDNPSNAVEWALAEMLNQPEILQKATEELDAVVGKDRLVHESDLPRLKYVKACVKESLRLHPFAPFNVPHVSTQDTVVGGYFIPKGSHVILSRPGLSRNPRIWEDPLMYMPERHMKDMDDARMDLNDPELNMFSFSTGRRGCPGVLLGSTLTVMLLARLLQCFSWKIPSGLSQIDLAECEDAGVLAKPLVAVAEPRFPQPN